jgi:hypothetical protein
MPLGEKKEDSVKPVEDKPIMEAVKRLSVVDDDLDKYSISVSKYIDIDDYLKCLLNVTHYELHPKARDKYKIVFYNKSRIVKVLHNCVCKDSTIYIPRVELAKRRCSLYNMYIMFKLF